LQGASNREKNIPAQEDQAQKTTRIQDQNGHQKRTADSQEPPGQGAEAIIRLIVTI